MKEIVKIRVAWIMIATAVGFILLALLGEWGQFGLFGVFTLPFDLAGRLIRAAGGVSNFLAFVIYFIVCLLPLIFPVIRCVKNKRVLPINFCWVAVSAFLFLAVYFFINPHKLQFVIPDSPLKFDAEFQRVALTGIAMTVYAVLALSFIAEFYSYQKEKGERIYAYAKVLFMILIIGVLCSVFFGELLAVKSLLAKLQQNVDSSGYINEFTVYKEVNIFVIILSYLLALVPAGFTIALFLYTMAFIDDLRHNMFAPENVPKLKRIIKYSMLTVCVTLGSMIVRNVLCLILSNKLINTYYTISIPFGMILAACLMTLFSKILIRAIEVNEENKLVI